MARPRSIDETDLIASLAKVFADVGYEGASLALLSKETGLQRASLYHRFPDGKSQMASAVLQFVNAWLREHILVHLNGSGPPAARLKSALGNFAQLYDSGRKSCLLNMLSSPRSGDGPFRESIGAAFDALKDGFARLALDAGHDAKTAELCGERAVMLIQGSLVMCRGTGTTGPFANAMASIETDLLGKPEPSA